ncbi:MAG: HDIG domain-containing protein [Desulfitobacteriaceae bacterium]|nr:HDIG domain-containing protein [Desulfitobacteriaceae bacterium]MDD4754068.1 HDIG domain-containing protein [Desulfitobacteriaceae bacterium]
MSNMQEIYLDIDRHLLHDEKPSIYLNTIFCEPIFCRPPFNALYKLKEAKQSPIHHPEGSVWNHTLLVVDEAAKVKNKSKDARAFMWAALLHDIGKPDTTKVRGGKITSYDHDKVGAKLAKEFLEEFTDDSKFVEVVATLIRWHMQILFVVKDWPFADIKTMKQQVDINEVALLGLCDRLGRLNEDREEEEKNIQTFIQKCNKC